MNIFVMYFIFLCYIIYISIDFYLGQIKFNGMEFNIFEANIIYFT